MKLNLRYKLIFYLFYLTCNNVYARSIYRKSYTSIPNINTYWENDKKVFTLRNSYLEEPVIFDNFDYDYLKLQTLPEGDIYYRTNKEKFVNGEYLDDLINSFIKELYNQKKTFKNFKVLKKNDFNFKNLSGNLILKFNDHPFILKLFIETPESFTQPHSKGWGPMYLFYMSGGISRYLCGFTRIKNLEIIKEKISKHETWSKMIDFPRKWFWLPKDGKWFTVESNNLGLKPRTIKLPMIYALVADFINEDKNNKLADDNFALKLSHYVDNRLDPHSDNLIIEKDTGKIVIIDTEHFPSMVGLTETKNFKSYLDWYLKLGTKCFRDIFLRNKFERNKLKTNPSPILKL